jgi:hypothetical protein
MYRAALVLAALLLLPGCGITRGEESAPPQNVTPADLARMVKKEHLGPLARGLRLDPEESGRYSNAREASESTDPKDSAKSLAKDGRVTGQYLGYSASSGRSQLGVVFVSESVELFRTNEAASANLKDVLADLKRSRGRTRNGAKIVRIEEFDVGTGDEAVGLQMTVRYPAQRTTLFATVTGFRRGRIVGSTAAFLRRDLVVTGDVERMADALDQQIVRVGSASS